MGHRARLYGYRSLVLHNTKRMGKIKIRWHKKCNVAGKIRHVLSNANFLLTPGPMSHCFIVQKQQHAATMHHFCRLQRIRIQLNDNKNL